MNERAERIADATSWIEFEESRGVAVGGMFISPEVPDLIVVLTTSAAQAEVLGDRRPASVRDFVVFEVRDYTDDDLLVAARSLVSDWQTIADSDDVPHTAATHLDRGSIELTFAPEAHVSEAMRQAAHLATGFPVEITRAEVDLDGACINRSDCHSPMRAGIQIRKGSTTGPRCTMGFHAQVGSDEQFLTAGHCGYTGSNNWYHAGYGFIGAETSGSYKLLGYDAMRVHISDTQDSNQVYGTTTATNARDPIKNETVCASLGVTQTIRCGQVTSSAIIYTSSTCGCQVIGFETNIGGTGGDSGSPVKAGTSTAVGLYSTTGGKIAPMQSVLNALGVGLRT